MILNFKPQFVDKIISGQKIHTIRKDKHNRWRDGMQIQFYTGARTKQAKMFAKGVVRKIDIVAIRDNQMHFREVAINGHRTNEDRVAKLDGFIDTDSFFNFFREQYGTKEGSICFNGKIIYWDNLEIVGNDFWT
jgi:hypothetical protein